MRKVNTLLRSAVLWVTAASIALAQIADQLTDLAPVLTQGAASLAAVVAIVRSVSPVAKDERGL